jgi:hypothetical protein
MPLENRDLAVGTTLAARYKKQDRTCEVVQTDDGVRYRLDDGTEHRSPSSAAKAVMGGIAANGWRFWSLQGELKPAREAKPKAEKPAKEKTSAKTAPAKKAASKKKPAAKKKAQRAADVASYACGGCGATFGSQKAAVAHALTHTS